MQTVDTTKRPSINRRTLLGAGLGTMALGHMSHLLAQVAASQDRILVVVELSGGNDGLNTLVPYGDDAYYRHRPTLGIRPQKLLKLDDHFGWNSGMTGFDRLYKDGKLAVMHGCGYEQPSFSHFTSMAYLHTAAPNSGEKYGWVGRLGDAIAPQATPNLIVNIDTSQSLAVNGQLHVPVVFDEPDRFTRKGSFQEKPFLDVVTRMDNPVNVAFNSAGDIFCAVSGAAGVKRKPP